MANTVAAPKKLKKYRVQATIMIWNGKNRIRPGTVFDLEWEEGKKLPRCVEEIDEKETEAVTLGKRERDGKPSNLIKDIPAPRGAAPVK